jgi:hypothetical protein
VNLAPVETKVWAAAGSGSVVSLFALWLLGVLVWHESYTASNATHAVAAVPTPVAAAAIAAITWIGGYLAPHTHRRPDVQVVPEVAPEVEPEVPPEAI